MKLFNPIEVKTDKDAQLAIGLKRKIDLDKELSIKRQELERLELEFEVSIEKERTVWEKEKKEQCLIINILKDEVIKLEEKRRELLLPLDEKWKELEKADVITKEREAKLAAKNDELNDRLELLEERLAEVSDRELSAQNLAQKQSFIQKGIDLQVGQVSAQNKAFNDLVAKSTEELREKEIILATKETRLNLIEATLNEKERNIIETEKRFIDRERQIQDRYATLERTIKRYGAGEKR